MDYNALKIEALESRCLLSVGITPTFMQFVKGAGHARTFAVLYDGPDPIDRASLPDYQIYVRGPGEFSAPATFLGAFRHDPGTGWVVEYQIDGIMGGTYVIKSPVRPAGAPGLPPSGDLGGFLVGRKGHTVPLGGATTPAITVVGTTFGTSEFPPAIDTSFGTVVRAVNFGGDAETVTGSTGVSVNFESQHAQSVGAKKKHPRGSRGSIQTVISSSGDPLFEQITGDNPIFETEILNASSSTMFLGISGLDAAKRYRIQFLDGDGSQGETPYGETSNKFSLPSGEFETTSLTFNNGESDADCIVTVDVSGTTGVEYGMPASQTRGASFSGVVIEESDDLAPATALVQQSMKLSGATQTFDLAFNGQFDLTAAKLASQTVVVNGPAGFSEVASLLKLTSTDDGTVATYKLDGIDVTGSYSIFVNGQQVGRATFFYLRPVIWI